MNTQPATTNRVTEEQLIKILENSVGFSPSPIKANWAYSIFYRGKEGDFYTTEIKGKGFHVKPIAQNMAEVHFSLTKLTNKWLMEQELAPSISQWCHDCGGTVGSMHPHFIKITPVRDGLFRLSAGEIFSDFVVAANEEEIQNKLFETLTKFNNYAHQWTKWSKEAEVKIVEEKEVYKMPNGLTVRFILDDSTYCETGWEGEYITHVTPNEFTWFLKRFF